MLGRAAGSSFDNATADVSLWVSPFEMFWKSGWILCLGLGLCFMIHWFNLSSSHGGQIGNKLAHKQSMLQPWRLADQQGSTVIALEKSLLRQSRAKTRGSLGDGFDRYGGSLEPRRIPRLIEHDLLYNLQTIDKLQMKTKDDPLEV